MVQTLAELQADINARDKNNTQPLHYAAQTSRPEVARCLVDLRADTRGCLLSGAAAGATPLDLAREAQRQAPSHAAMEVLRILSTVSASVSEAPWWSSAVQKRSAIAKTASACPTHNPKSNGVTCVDQLSTKSKSFEVRQGCWLRLHAAFACRVSRARHCWPEGRVSQHPTIDRAILPASTSTLFTQTCTSWPCWASCAGSST